MAVPHFVFLRAREKYGWLSLACEAHGDGCGLRTIETAPTHPWLHTALGLFLRNRQNVSIAIALPEAVCPLLCRVTTRGDSVAVVDSDPSTPT